ncbi:hypothetical protein IWX90DRAFT_482298 [Phyllosticta citrichinensis]|uniref:MYND-type domain-containing protein n=1 Tax=Phyllosticta citrichinensis TaxID=1130410 RepID=A0ABR1Y773_9PEZI
MAAPTRLDIAPLFRPTGNSPPVYLAQYLRREEAAKILSLGCGDIRNVLFTAYCERDHDRPLDITCCDVEKMVIARNIFLLSILVDSESSAVTDAALFGIFTDMVLNEQTFQVFRKQGKKLRQRAKSLERWHNSIYGKVIRFCDSASLDRVREVWECYSKGDASDYTQFETMLKGARDVGKAKGVSAELLMASAPLNTGPHTLLENLRETYWKLGQLGYESQEEVEEERLWNPTFGCRAAHTVLNPSTFPLEGFHLALGQDCFDEISPMAKLSPEAAKKFAQMAPGMMEFFAWCGAFRQGCQDGKITLRFAVGDALAFCYAVRDLHPGTPQPASRWAPRGPLKMQNMDLNSPDYTPEVRSEPEASESSGTAAGPGKKGPKAKSKAPETNFKAPIRFNAIDTGRLVDKCGSLNILLATAPLLDWSLSSTLVTEVSLTEDPNETGVLVGLFPGHFDTVAVVIGLMPVEFWCNATSVPPVSRTFSLLAQRLLRKHPTVKTRICWKSCIANDVILDGMGHFTGLWHGATALASFVHILYANMFGLGKSTLPRRVKRGSPLLHHTQATFVALLERIKYTAFTAWGTFAKDFLSQFDEAAKSTGRGYFSELLVQLHRFGVLDFADSRRLLGPPFSNATLVHATLQVPREVFQFLWGINLSKLGDLRVVCTVWHSESVIMDFGVLRMTFGTIRESAHAFGRRSWRLVIEEDQVGWLGFSPLLVTFCAPSLTFSEPDLVVAFRLEQDSETAEVLGPILGPSKVIFETGLDNEEGIFVCSEPPVILSPEDVTDQRHDRLVPGDLIAPRRQNPTGPNPQQLFPASGTVASASVEDQQAPVAARTSASAEDQEDALAAGVLQNGHDPASTGSASKELPDKQLQPELLYNVRLYVVMNEVGEMGAMSAQLILKSEEWKTKFSNGAKVTAKLASPCGLAVSMEGSAPVGHVLFPVPIIQSEIMVLRNPEESTVVVTVAPGDPLEERYIPILMWSSFLFDGTIVVNGVSSLALDGLPTFDKSRIGDIEGLKSLIFHVLSSPEARIPHDGMERSCDPRIGFKNELMELFKGAAGLDRPLKTFFVFCDESNNDRFMICVSAVRFDMNEQSIVLDAAIVTVTARNRTRVKMFANTCFNKHGAPGDEVRRTYILNREIPLWKKMFAGAVERARTWSHRDDCEYKAAGRMPLGYDAYKEFLCSCGHGKLPENFYARNAPGWDKLQETAVRAAISPCFASMLVEPQRMNKLVAECAGRKADDADCFNCRKTPEELGGTTMSKCAGCGVAKYCSRECQKEAWKMHKSMCGFYTGFGNNDRER